MRYAAEVIGKDILVYTCTPVAFLGKAHTLRLGYFDIIVPKFAMRSWIHSVKPLGNFHPPNPSGTDPTISQSTASTQESYPSPLLGDDLPSLFEAITDASGDKDGPLARALAFLFEASPILYSDLVPGVVSFIRNSPQAPILSYFTLADASIYVVSTWSDDLQAQFITGHPRIGEVHGLSKLSSLEQAVMVTSPDILARLAHLNALYERKYPGLVYITFVNRRSRAQIKDEMEDKLGLEHSVSPDEPLVASIVSVEAGSGEWKEELERAVKDVGRIAYSRLRSWDVVDSVG